jgi:hypothetical protein
MKAYLLQIKHQGDYITQLIIAARKDDAILTFLNSCNLFGKVASEDIKILFVWSKDNIKAILEELA